MNSSLIEFIEFKEVWNSLKIFSIIILFEIVVGTFSAAVLIDELIGWREILGSSFIIFAGLTEIIFASRTEDDVS